MQAYSYMLLVMLLLLAQTPAYAWLDTYPQATYECEISVDKTQPGVRRLSIKVSNRSRHIHIYGFRVKARYLDCNLNDPNPSREFLKRGCSEKAVASMALGSIARPPRDDIHVPPGQTRSYQYRFRYPGKPSHRKHKLEHCETYSTATFSAADAPRILGLVEEEPQEPGFWQRWWKKIKSWFE